MSAYRIVYRIYTAGLGEWWPQGTDVDAMARAYRDALDAAIRQRYPDADVEVELVHHAAALSR